MTRESMLKIKWIPYMSIIYHPPKVEFPTHMMVLGVDFENEIVICQPVDQDIYKQEEYYLNMKFCEIPPRKLKIEK